MVWCRSPSAKVCSTLPRAPGPSCAAARGPSVPVLQTIIYSCEQESSPFYTAVIPSPAGITEEDQKVKARLELLTFVFVLFSVCGKEERDEVRREDRQGADGELLFPLG